MRVALFPFILENDAFLRSLDKSEYDRAKGLRDLFGEAYRAGFAMREASRD